MELRTIVEFIVCCLLIGFGITLFEGQFLKSFWESKKKFEERERDVRNWKG